MDFQAGMWGNAKQCKLHQNTAVNMTGDSCEQIVQGKNVYRPLLKMVNRIEGRHMKAVLLYRAGCTLLNQASSSLCHTVDCKQSGYTFKWLEKQSKEEGNTLLLA